MSTAMASGLAQLASYSTRAAKAAALLSEFRDEDVQIATTPREAVAQIGGRTLYRIAVDAPKRVKTPCWSYMRWLGTGPSSTCSPTDCS